MTRKKSRHVHCRLRLFICLFNPWLVEFTDAEPAGMEEWFYILSHFILNNSVDRYFSSILQGRKLDLGSASNLSKVTRQLKKKKKKNQDLKSNSEGTKVHAHPFAHICMYTCRYFNKCNIYKVPGSVLSVLQILTHLILMSTLGNSNSIPSYWVRNLGREIGRVAGAQIW
jgi:hypothetical protein